MLSERSIQQAVQRIVKAAQPRRVILFGSYARGQASADSDLDLIVVLSGTPNKHREMARLRSAVGMVGVGVDVLVFSEEELQRRSRVPGTVAYWATKEGRVVYEAAA
jgi:predicted nucleotidyltransferase